MLANASEIQLKKHGLEVTRRLRRPYVQTRLCCWRRATRQRKSGRPFTPPAQAMRSASRGVTAGVS